MPIQEGGTFTPNPRIISPGVFTRENDLSGIAQGVADIGGVIVAPFPKGPGFSPTLFTNINELQKQFGVPDGVYYGPYAASEYLKERGMVTVCRVGSLTGYKQAYPFAIWAVRGTWGRHGSAGSLDSNNSYVFFSGSITENYSSSISINSTSSVIAISDASLTVKFAADPADQSDLIPGNSGSVLYAGQTISLGVSSTALTGIASISDINNLSASIANGTFSASLDSPITLSFSNADEPFKTITLHDGTISVLLGTCSTPSIVISGVISGSFGAYNGIFTQNPEATFDPCTNTWTSSASSDVRLLAVLADTQYAGISDLVAPGFNGSTMTLAETVDGKSEVPLEYNIWLKNTNSTTAYGTYQVSFDSSNTSYITNVFGTNPKAGDPNRHVTGQKIEAAYLYKIFENAISEVAAERNQWKIFGNALPSGSNYTGEPLDFTDEYSRDLTNGDSEFSLTHASTPWIISQKISPWQSGGEPTRYRLFRCHTLSDGTNTNTSYKIEISQVKLAGTVPGTDWGTFTLTVRSYSDSDKKPVILEQFNNLTLDPDSSNYIARRIGDRYNYIDYKGKVIEFGTFQNNSKYIRIEMNNSTWPVFAVPYGFEAYAVPINSSMGYWTPTMKYTKASVYSLNPGKYPSGITFNDAPVGADSELYSLYPTSSIGVGAAYDNKQYMAPLPKFGAYNSVGRNIPFALDDDYREYGVGTGEFFTDSNAVPTVYDAVNENTYVKMRKFVLGFQGGFDGQSPAIPINIGADISPGNTQGLDCTSVSSAGSIAYNQCISALGNADEWDINLIVTPGIVHQHHPYITNLVVDMCEKRGDCFYIMDLYVDDGNPSGGQIDEVVRYASQFDTSYAAAYYPWVKIIDTNTNKIVTVPPSVIMPAIYASNDKVSAEWFAPAGLNRGGIPIAVQVTDRTTHEERDALYEGKVNPIAAFPGSGIVVWGQKTLQIKASAFDRINVRRLLINIKKYFASVSKYLVFEQNVAATRNKFLSIVNPYLESVQQRAGLYSFYVKMDESNNTPDIIDQNILYGQIYLKPTKTAEYIVLDFNILPTGLAMPNG